MKYDLEGSTPEEILGTLFRPSHSVLYYMFPLAKQVETWTSPVYNHYKSPPTIFTDPHGVLKYRFICKAYVHRLSLSLLLLTYGLYSHPEISVVRARHDVSTSNLNQHEKKCNGVREANQTSVTSFTHGSTYSKELLHVYVALWTATSYRPFTIAEDPYFVKIVKMFNPNAVLPSDTTVSKDIREFFQIGRKNLKTFIAVRSRAAVRTCVYSFHSRHSLAQSISRWMAGNRAMLSHFWVSCSCSLTLQSLNTTRRATRPQDPR